MGRSRLLIGSQVWALQLGIRDCGGQHCITCKVLACHRDKVIRSARNQALLPCVLPAGEHRCLRLLAACHRPLPPPTMPRPSCTCCSCSTATATPFPSGFTCWHNPPPLATPPAPLSTPRILHVRSCAQSCIQVSRRGMSERPCFSDIFNSATYWQCALAFCGCCVDRIAQRSQLSFGSCGALLSPQ